MWKTYLFGPATDLKIPFDKYLSYVTPHSVTTSIVRHADRQFPGGLKGKVLWDVFTGIGSDALLFAPHVKTIFATEIHPETYQCAVENLKGQDNLTLVQADCTGFTCQADIAYCDPPWGTSFKPGEPFSFEGKTLANGQFILDFIRQIKTPYLIIKSPLLSDSFETLFPADSVLNMYLFTQQKLKFIFIKNF
jgi:predicted RNA methylase